MKHCNILKLVLNVESKNWFKFNMDTSHMFNYTVTNTSSRSCLKGKV
jgi:hypothetical protein